VTNDVTQTYLQKIELQRNDAAQVKQEKERQQIEIQDPTSTLIN
jgi:hypothetical protein